MKTLSRISLMISSFLLVSSVLLAEGDLQTWHDIYGRNFAAEIVSANPAIVRLKNAEGKEIDFQIMHLTPESQLQVRKWEDAKIQATEGSEFVKEFKEDLVILDGNSLKNYEDLDLPKVKYFAFYNSASWCGPCRKFTPELVKFYNKIKPNHPEFELILVSYDQSKDDMKNYMKTDKMAWPAFRHGKHQALVPSFGNGIPCLMVTDATGKKLFDSYTKEGKYLGPSSVMREIEKLLK